MKIAENFAGRTVGNWLVIERVIPIMKGRPEWTCKCVCGNIRVVGSQQLRAGRSRSCGCIPRAAFVASHTTHGATRGGGSSKTFIVWSGMKGRCRNPNNKKFSGYGGRGIRFCKRWEKFENFLADMGERPAGKTLDRKNNDGHYCKRNCRWATSREQANNRRSNLRITLKSGEVITFANLVARTGLTSKSLKYHARIRGGDYDAAIEHLQKVGDVRRKYRLGT